MANFRVTFRITDEKYLDEWVAFNPPLMTMWLGPAQDEEEARRKASAQHLNPNFRKGAIIQVIRK